MHVTHPQPFTGPKIGVLTCRMVNGVLFLFDAEGRRLDTARSITVRQSVDDLTIATVELIIDMANGSAE